jgi:hypothetical protein
MMFETIRIAMGYILTNLLLVLRGMDGSFTPYNTTTPSGEKGLTRDENDREVQLEQEFDEFATQRLKAGGNCHRSDIVKSFRRYFAKYRQADGEQYPLTDREIEMLLKRWNQQKNMGKAEMSSSGFYYGIQINTDADVFV